jgi:geranylgeranyl pyrophosphate synthase
VKYLSIDERKTENYILIVRYGHGHDQYIKEIKAVNNTQAIEQAEAWINTLTDTELEKLSRVQLKQPIGGMRLTVLFKY